MTSVALITGAGHYLPPRCVTNADLPPGLKADPEGITKRTGIKQRQWADVGVYTSDLAANAGRAALESAGLQASELDCIIAATLSPDYCFPGLGVYTQVKLGIENTAAYDIRNQCSGFLYSLNVGRAFIEAGIYRKILVVGAELHSHALGKTELHTHISPLFGDGAGAVILQPAEDVGERATSTSPRLSVDYLHVYADGKGGDRLRQRVWDISLDPFMDWAAITDSSEKMWYAEMDGQYIFRKAVIAMSKVAKQALADMNLKLEDIDWVIPHQANQNINNTVASALGVPPEKMLSNIERVGNTTAGSIPILLSETLIDGKIAPGDRVMLLAFGAGLTWGAAILTALPQAVRNETS